jgi:hypothetical protein
MDEFYVEKNIYFEKMKTKRIGGSRSAGLATSRMILLGWDAVKDLQALDEFAQQTNDSDIKESKPKG